MFGNALIKYVTNSTCLGIVIDNRLAWTKHHENVMKSFSAKVKELKRFIYLPRTVQEQIYYKAVITAITYCIAVRGTASDSHLDELDTLTQKRQRSFTTSRRTVQMKKYYKTLTGNQLVTCINEDC